MATKFDDLQYPTVIIIGGGFAGLKLAKKLSRRQFKVYLLDKNNYHTFQPLLYQVATGGLGSDSIAYPFRRIIGPLPNVAFRMARVEHIDAPANTIYTDVGKMHYDYLVIATGSNTNFFDNKSIEETSMPIKSIPESLDIRSDILQQFEKALVERDMAVKERYLSFVIVGGGPTGVELSGAMAEIKKNVIPNDYTEIDPTLMKIQLIEASDRLLSAMSPQASAAAEEFLKKLGVKVMLNTTVTGYDGQELTLNDGTSIPTETVIWSAGVKGSIIEGLVPEAVERGRYKVDEVNRVKGYTNIFAIGDVAMMQTADYPKGHPMVAPVAIQQASLLYTNLLALQKNGTLKPFKYLDKGSMATIGRNKAVVDLPFVKFKGWFAWYVWMLIHLLMLIGFRNRFIVFINWVWSYFTYQYAIRLIIRPYTKKSKRLKAEQHAVV